MKTLFDILQGLELTAVSGPDPKTVAVQAIRFDSREVNPGDVFVAVRGVHADGHLFIDKALANGAIAIVAEEPVSTGVTVVQVADTASILGKMASAFYNNPSEQLQLVGVTGTNGKTTVATLLWQCFSLLGFHCGLIGTVENRIGETRVPATHTTPDAVQLQALLRSMVDAGCSHAFMEVSSHAIHQHRIAGTKFVGAVFTNLTHDHLDYHGSFANYRDAKKMLFDGLPAGAFALVNADDKNGRFMCQNTRAKVYSYGLRTPADFKGKILEDSLNGLYLRIDDADMHARMIGAFNASNLLSVYAVANLLGHDKTTILTALSTLRGAPGRFDHLALPTGATGVVDYAHTPDAVEKVLETIRKLRKPGAKIITVIGCGGDRDRTKRPVMAKTAARLSDQVVLTSDNPRTEDPAVILKEMEAGLDATDLSRTLTIENREQAIKTAVRLAGKGDIILIAGKGHETYQEIKGVKYPFDDKEVLLKST